MDFQQIEKTGCRLVGAITKFGHAGPKHHGVIIGRSTIDHKVYIAESCHTGYQLVSFEEFVARYSNNGEIQILPNIGEFSDFDVASRALNEVINGGQGAYNLFLNNCESFSNRAMFGQSTSFQVSNTLTVTALLIAGIWIIKQTNKS